MPGDVLFGSEPEPAQLVDTTPAEFEGLRGPVANRLRKAIESGGGPAFSGDLVAPLSPTEQAIVARIGKRATGPQPLRQKSRAMLGRTMSGDCLDPASTIG